MKERRITLAKIRAVIEANGGRTTSTHIANALGVKVSSINVHLMRWIYEAVGIARAPRGWKIADKTQEHPEYEPPFRTLLECEDLLTSLGHGLHANPAPIAALLKSSRLPEPNTEPGLPIDSLLDEGQDS